jgi:hypothetical protein
MCNVVSRLCVSGCRKGWMGPYCQQRKFIGFIIYNTDHTVNSINSMCLFMEGAHQTYIVYGSDSSNLCCLRSGHI